MQAFKMNNDSGKTITSISARNRAEAEQTARGYARVKGIKNFAVVECAAPRRPAPVVGKQVKRTSVPKVAVGSQEDHKFFMHQLQEVCRVMGIPA